MGKCIITRRGLDTSDATATAADIALDKSAYVNGTKLVGTSTAKDVAVTQVTVEGINYTFTTPEIVGKENVVIIKEATNSEIYQPNEIVCGCYLNNGAIKSGILLNPVSNTITYLYPATFTANFETGRVTADQGKTLCGKYRVVAW